MTQHSLQGRRDDEVLWFQRRSFLQGAAAFTALGGWGGAWAQSRSNIVELRGDALVNGERLSPQQTIQTGDTLQTGPQSTLTFVLGNSAFHVRQNSNIVVERGATLTAVSLLRMLSGAVVSVWGKGSPRQIITPTLTAGIRGTGVYTEIFANQGLMKHLAANGIPVPDPAANADGDVLHRIQGKPAAVVNRLRGGSELAPSAAHCATVGAMLARMHLAGQSFEMRQPNLRGLPWWNETVPVVLPHLDAPQAELLRAELAYQNHVAAQAEYVALPRGAIHADLFRDNVMFAHDLGDGAVPELTGFFDFYFAGVDTWLFDLAVCLNDWCVDLPTGANAMERARAFVAAYQQVRPLTASERALLPAMLRAGALRFWLSRLWDFYLPRDAALLKPHDPTHFERVLRQRLEHPLTLSELET